MLFLRNIATLIISASIQVFDELPNVENTQNMFSQNSVTSRVEKITRENIDLLNSNIVT